MIASPNMTTSVPRSGLSVAQLVPRAFFQRSIGWTCFALVRTWLAICVCWVGAGLVGDSDWRWVVWPLVVVMLGTLQYHLNVLGHDGLHGLLSSSRQVNDGLCRWLVHGPHGAPLGAMRRNHLQHHVDFGGDADLDRQYYDIRRFRSPAALRFWLSTSVLGGMTLPIVVKLMRRRTPLQPASPTVTPAATAGASSAARLDLLSVLTSQAWIAVACAIATQLWYGYLLFWAIPLITVMFGLNTIRSCLEHAQAGSKDPGLFSFQSHLVERFFLSPFNMNIHAEHHMVPAVPWHQLPSLRAFLQREQLDGDVRRSRSYLARVGELTRPRG